VRETGKTNVAANLAATPLHNGHRVQLLDCGVEAPNRCIFVRPTVEQAVTVGLRVPEVDKKECAQCDACGEVCLCSAIVRVQPRSGGTLSVLSFPDLCHGRRRGFVRKCAQRNWREDTRVFGKSSVEYPVDGAGREAEAVWERVASFV